MIKETYQKLQKEHPLLPDFDKLNNEFEISTIENEEFLLREIMRAMAERLEQSVQILERLISPDPNSFTDLHECRSFTAGEKKQLIDTFRNLMKHFRLLLETELALEPKKDAEAIRAVFDMWQKERKQIAPAIKKIKESWEKQVEPKEVLEYLG